MRKLLLILLLLPLSAISQMGNHDACWCYASEFDSLGKPTKHETIVYPLPVQRNGAWGLLDKEGNTVEEFVDNDPYLMTDSGKVVLKNFEIVDQQWEVTDKSYLSILDSNGVEIRQYRVRDIYKGTFLATRDGENYGLLDSEFNELMEFKYIAADAKDRIFEFSSKGYLSCRENKAGSDFGAVNYKGKTIIPFKWRQLSFVIEDEDHIYAMNDYLKRGYINIKGQTTLSFIYEMVPRVLTDSNMVKTKKYIWFLDRNLKQIGPKYEAYEKKGNLWFFKVNGKWGIRDNSGNEIIPPTYSSIMDGPRIKGNKDFKCYIVVKYGKYGLINLDGSEIIKPAYGCLCGLGYFAPADYYIEFQNEAGVSYKFNEKGELIEKGGKSGGNCFCE